MSLSLKSISISTKHSVTPFIISVIAISCSLFSSQIESFGIYNKYAIENGEIWRLITGHLLHTNGYHLLLNMAGLWLLWLLHSNFYHTRVYITLLLFCALTVGLGIYNFSTLTHYVGLSGVLHGVFAWGACKDIENKDSTGYLLLIGLVAKLIHEQVAGASEDIATLIEASVAIDAHLYGAIAGLTYFFICKKTKI